MPDGDAQIRSGVVLRPYQQDLLTKATDGKAERTCIYLPTGAGKSELAMKLSESFLGEGDSVVWCVHRLEIINQTSDRFLAAGLDHGVIQADNVRTASWKPFQLASIATLGRRKLQPVCKVIVIDEAHRATGDQYKSFLALNPDVPVFGLSATPFSRGLGKVFQRLVHGVTVTDLTEQGWLVPARIYAPDRPDLTGVHTIGGDYNEKELAEAVDKGVLVGNICTEWSNRANNERTIIFATSIEHSKHITSQFTFRGIAAEHIDCYTPTKERKEILDRLRAGTTRVVSNCSVLSEGFDLPAIGCIVLARPTKSLTLYLQMVGRALRPAPGKTSALILDHSSTVELLGLPTDDLPLFLDMGLPRAKSKTPPPKLHTCPRCTFISKRKPNPCASCGYMPPKPEFDINQREGTLHEFKREIPELPTRQHYYSGLIYIQRDKGYNNGWVAHKYRERYGVWPQKDLKWYPQPPSTEVMNHLLAARIRWAKTKAAEARHGR